MPIVRFLTAEGERSEIDVADGSSVMAAAQQHGVPGIVADCGGSCSCATCHVYVDPELADRFDPVSGFEDELLDTTACDRLPNSRLSCQLLMSRETDGVEIRIPETQI